jgi:hypothetical protein
VTPAVVGGDGSRLGLCVRVVAGWIIEAVGRAYERASSAGKLVVVVVVVVVVAIGRARGCLIVL